MTTFPPLSVSHERPLAVLHVEDAPGDAAILRTILDEDCALNAQVTTVDRLEDALRYLRAQLPDVVLLDLSLPDCQGVETYDRVRAAAPDLPIVVLTANDDPDLAAQLVRKGLQDLLLKTQLTGASCTNAIRFALARQQFAQELAARTHQLEESEERYRCLVESSPEAIVVGSEDKFLFVNPAALALFGATDAAQLVGQPVLERVAPEYRELVQQSIAALKVGTRVPLQAGKFLRLDGGEVDVEAIGSRVTFQGLAATQVAIRDVTERRRAEAAAQRERDFSQSLIASLQDGLAVLDRRGVHLAVNPALCALTGFSEAELVGSGPPHPYWPPEAYVDIQRAFQETLRGEFHRLELTVIRKDGHRFPALVSPSCIRDDAGQVIVYFAMVKEITERKRAEVLLQIRLQLTEAAQQANVDRLLQMALDQAELLTDSCLGFFHFVDETDLTLQAFSTNTLQHACTANGRGRHLAVTQAGVWADCLRTGQPVIHNDYASLPQQRGLPEGHAPLVRELVVPIRRGGLVVALMGVGNKPTAYTAEDVAGVEAVASIVTDLALRQRAQEEFEHFFRLVPELVCVASADGYFRRLNPQWERTLGYSQAELLAVPYLEFVHPEDRDATLQEAQREISGQATTRFTNRYRAKDDSWHWLEWDTTPLTPEGHIFAAARDITERMRCEQALAEAQQTAETANQAKSQFLASMSHEIRSPMTAILGFAELLEMGDLTPDEHEEFLRLLRTNGEALLSLINDVLDLSRIEAGRLVIDRADCVLQQLIQESLAVVGVRAEEKGLNLEVRYQPPLPERIQTDRTRLRQILVNLLVNAVKFTDRGEICLTVSCLGAGEGPARLQFAVSDTGIGIAADKLGGLFQPFVQAASNVACHYGGTGLGLAISRRLARALGGDIEVTSGLGRGSTFTVTIDPGPLPDPRNPPASPAAAQQGERTPAEQPRTLLHGRVLLADDLPSMHVFARQLLRRYGLEVEVAGDGQQACERVEAAIAAGQPYDLVLMDIQMPILDGYEATRRLRRHGWSGPIVALTAHAMLGDRERCLEAGCDDYLAKPISVPALRDILVRYLS